MKKNSNTLVQPFNKISFYVVPHADDWQLFMHPNAYNDLVDPGCKVVFLIITAGDAGKENDYWLAREEGVKSAIRFCLAPRVITAEAGGKKQVNSHAIQYWSLNEVSAYFLRIPDGNLDGSGFAAYNSQSLFKLSTGQISSITALDNSTTYHGWPAFIATAESIIRLESEGISERWINYLNPDATLNSGDHTDHLSIGHAIQQMKIITTLHQVLYVGYSIDCIEDTLSLTDLFWKAGMLAVYEKAVYDLCGYSTLQENMNIYVRWCCSKPKFLTILSKV